MNGDGPCAARHALAQRQCGAIPARTGRVYQSAAVFHPIRTAQDDRQRQIGNCARVPIAGQQGQDNLLARAVGPAIRAGENVDLRCRGPSGHATVRQVELWIGQRQEGEIARAICQGHQCRRGPGRSVQKTRRKPRIALGIGACFSQHGIGAA